MALDCILQIPRLGAAMDRLQAEGVRDDAIIVRHRTRGMARDPSPGLQSQGRSRAEVETIAPDDRAGMHIMEPGGDADPVPILPHIARDDELSTSVDAGGYRVVRRIGLRGGDLLGYDRDIAVARELDVQLLEQ